MAMTLKVTVTRELTRYLDSKEVVAADLDAEMDALALECRVHGTVVEVRKEQLVG